MSRIARALTLVSLLAASLWPMPTQAAAPSKVVLISLDGAGERIVSRFVSTGRMRNLLALKRSGVHAEYSLTNFPSKTAAGHASLWTGAYGAINGVVSNEVLLTPRSEHTLLETRSGFDASALKAEPLWTTVARAGKVALCAQATHEQPFSLYGPTGWMGGDAARRILMFDSYTAKPDPEWIMDATRSLRPAVGWIAPPQSNIPRYEVMIQAGDTSLYGLFYDDPQDPVDGYDTLMLRTRKDRAEAVATLKAGPCTPGTLDKFSPPIPVVADGAVSTATFRLFDLSPDLKHVRLYRTALCADRSNRPDLLDNALIETGSMIQKGAEALYAKGKLGRTLVEGGDGTAEDRLIETIHLAISNQIDRLRYSASHYPWDLLVDYLPYPDGIEHVWWGLIDDKSPAYRRDIAPRLMAYMDEVMAMVDEFIGAAREAADDRAAVAVVSDHGMDGLSRNFLPNVALRKAGLLALDSEGHIDLARTRAYYPPTDGAFVVLNTTDRKGGIVTPAQAPGVMARVIAALKRVRDPLTRRPAVTGFWVASHADPQLGIGGPAGGDLYLDLAPGLSFQADYSGNALFVPRSPYQSGGHMFNPARTSMHAIFYLAGPGVARNIEIPPVRTIDVAPTVCHLLGLPAPANATGRVLSEALIP